MLAAAEIAVALVVLGCVATFGLNLVDHLAMRKTNSASRKLPLARDMEP